MSSNAGLAVIGAAAAWFLWSANNYSRAPPSDFNSLKEIEKRKTTINAMLHPFNGVYDAQKPMSYAVQQHLEAKAKPPTIVELPIVPDTKAPPPPVPVAPVTTTNIPMPFFAEASGPISFRRF